MTEISAHNLSSQHQQKVSHNDNNTTMSRQQSTNTKYRLKITNNLFPIPFGDAPKIIVSILIYFSTFANFKLIWLSFFFIKHWCTSECTIFSTMKCRYHMISHSFQMLSSLLSNSTKKNSDEDITCLSWWYLFLDILWRKTCHHFHMYTSLFTTFFLITNTTFSWIYRWFCHWIMTESSDKFWR